MALHAILHNKTIIQEILSADPQFILDKVREKELITGREYTKLNSINKGDAEDVVIKLVDKLINKGRQSEFIGLLQDEKVLETYPQLKDVEWEDNGSTASSSSLSIGHGDNKTVVEPWKKTGGNGGRKRNRSESEEEVTNKMLEGLEDMKDLPVETRPLLTDASQIKGQEMEDKYPLTSEPTGLCVIINNETFKVGPKEEKRRGTQKDAESLANVFSWLGFQVLMCKDNTGSDMEEVTELLANPRCMAQLQKYKLEEWSDGRFTGLSALPQHGDAFVCCVLSHGDEDVVLGIDFKEVPIRKMTSAFNGKNCRDLIGKPKVFFIQACQGESLQTGVTVDSLHFTKVEKEYFPIEADFLVSKATGAKYQAVRKETGSSFIQSLCKQLHKGCSRGEDILKILVRVNAEISKNCLIEDSDPKEILMQMPEFSVTLRHNLVFSPCSS